MRYVASTQAWVKVPDLLIFATFYVYRDIWCFWGSRYKRRSNFSYIDCYTPTLFWWPRWGMWQVPRMGESTDLWYLPLFTQLTILFTYIETYGFWGPVIKEGLILVISIVTLQNYFWRPRMGENTGTFWYLPLLDPAHYSTYVFGGGGGRYKRRSNFSYIDCYTPTLFWRPRWGMWQVPRMGTVTPTVS